jgi:hypothetical protein
MFRQGAHEVDPRRALLPALAGLLQGLAELSDGSREVARPAERRRPDGKLLLSGGADGSVQLWDVEARRERGAYRWGERWVNTAAFSPDGMKAAAAGEDAAVFVWDVDP